MKGDDRLLSFNYLDVLSALEQECRAQGGWQDPVKDGDRGRVRVFGSLKALVGMANNIFRLRDRNVHRVKLGLGIAAAKIREKEGLLLDAIAKVELAGGAASAPRKGGGFPGEIGSRELAGRLVATVLGLHVEHRYDPGVAANLRQSLERAARSILAPALAWNLLVQVGRHHPDHQPELIRRAKETLRTGFVGANPGTVDCAHGRAQLPALEMARAWMRVLRDTYGLAEDVAAEAVGGAAAGLIEGDDLEPAMGRLKPTVRKGFDWGDHGSERALAIHLASQAGGRHAGIETRVDLLQAASSAQARAFHLQLNQNPAAALDQAERELRQKFSSPLAPAGLAFWLSRHGFRRTKGGSFVRGAHGVVDTGRSAEECRTLDRASALFLRAMDAALEAGKTTAEQRALLLRFRAGYATNPRFWRGETVINEARKLVDAYAAAKEAKSGLVALFEARLELETDFAKGKEGAVVPVRALGHYLDVLRKIEGAPQALDAEAPLHLFPEIVAVLSMGPKENRAKVRSALQDVDLILACNFGVYMDIDEEEACILGGLRQAKAWRQPSTAPDVRTPSGT